MTDLLTAPFEVGEPEPDPSRPDPAVPAGEPEGGWDRVRVIESLRTAAVRAREAEVDQYALIAAAADVYSWVDNSHEAVDVFYGNAPRTLYGERLWQFGADGTPEVAEFITFEVGPALGISPESAATLIADVLDLRHRLPRTWQLVLQGRVLGWLYRRIAQNTRQLKLSIELTRELDRHIAPFLEGWTPHQTLLRVAMLIARLDPEGTEERRRVALADRYMHIDTGESGTATVRGQMDGPGGRALDQTLDDLAEVLQAGGLDGTRRELRAAAMEALADPCYAADLLNGVIDQLPLGETDTDANAKDVGPAPHQAEDPDVECNESACGHAGGSHTPRPGGGPGTPSPSDLVGAGATTIRGRGNRDLGCPITAFGSPWQIGTLNLDLHLTLADLVHGAGGHSTQLGELALSQIQQLIARAGKLVITPILDPLTPQGVEGYDIPDRIARAVKLRNPTVVFPFSNRSSTSSHVQCDHVIPHPEGPTHSDNLAPTITRAHRAKTFGGYRKITLRPGVYHWTTPTGQDYWVTPHGTHRTNPDTTPPPQRVRLADRARDAFERGRNDKPQSAKERVRDRLPAESLQPELIPDPDPRPNWKGNMTPPVIPDLTTPPPF